MARTKPRADLDIHARRTWDGVVWHHSTTKAGMSYDWDSIKEFHTSYRVDGKAMSEADYRRCFINHKGKEFGEPMRSVGYHFGVEYAEGEGGIFSPIIHVGRSLDLNGEHASYRGNPTFNNRYIGLVAVGNFDAKTMRPEMWDSCLRLTRVLMDNCAFGADRVISHTEADKIIGVAPRSCPGALIDMAKFRKDL